MVNRKDVIFHHDNDDEAVKSHLVQFFADKDQKFYEREIMKLPERWRNTIEQNGKYIID